MRNDHTRLKEGGLIPASRVEICFHQPDQAFTAC